MAILEKYKKRTTVLILIIGCFVAFRNFQECSAAMNEVVEGCVLPGED